jgi:hypothetical protein
LHQEVEGVHICLVGGLEGVAGTKKRADCSLHDGPQDKAEQVGHHREGILAVVRWGDGALSPRKHADYGVKRHQIDGGRALACDDLTAAAVAAHPALLLALILHRPSGELSGDL